MRKEKDNYNALIAKNKEDKLLFLINNVLKDKKISMKKSFNYAKVEEIAINDHTLEMAQLSEELLASNERIEEMKKASSNREAIVVDLSEDAQLLNDEIIASNDVILERNDLLQQQK